MLSACDPYQLVFIKNYTDKEIKINVTFQKQHGGINNCQIKVADTLIDVPKHLLHYKFIHKTVPDFTSDTSYMVKLPSKSTGLLCPLTIGFPIDKVYINGVSGQDSILFYRTKANMKLQLRKGKLEKINWAFFIYNYGKSPASINH